MEVKILELRYLGNTKPQTGFDERVAFGHDGEAWVYIFPESALMTFFSGVTVDPTAATTLYGVLGLSRDASQDEIRRAFRAAARQWHADVNTIYNDSNSAFIRIKEAYDILSNPKTRARYDAGLALEATIKKHQKQAAAIKQNLPQGYKPARRCGYVLVEGDNSSRGQFVVSKILDWQPIANEKGQILVSTWDMAAKSYKETWMATAIPPR